MLHKIGQHTKSSILIGHNFLSDSRITIENNKAIDAGGPAQQEIGMCSSWGSKTYSQCFQFFLRKKRTSFNWRCSTNFHNTKYWFFMHCGIFLCYCIREVHRYSLIHICIGTLSSESHSWKNLLNKFATPIDHAEGINIFWLTVSWWMTLICHAVWI